MPLIIGRRHPVIEVELILAIPGEYDLGESVSETQNTGELILIRTLGESISDTDGSIVSNYLIDANAISDSIVSGDLLRTLDLGENISEDFLDGNTYIYLSQNSYSDGVNDFTYTQWLEAQAISETDTLGDLLRTYGLGETQSDSDSEYLWLSAWPLGETTSDTEGIISWAYLLRGSAESDSDAQGEMLTTHQPGQAISDTESPTIDWVYTFGLGESISDSLSEFGFTFAYTGNAISETYGSWILSIRMGETVSDTDGEYSFIGKAQHDLIELDDTIGREIIATASIFRTVDVDVYLIRK